MLSASLEDYLEEMYRLSVEKGAVRTSDIATCLNVTLPSVSRALQRLNEDGYIDYRPYQAIQLTEKGKSIGEYLVERNRLLQDFLKIIGSDCDSAKEAEAMEHYLSRPTILAIQNLVHFLQIEVHQKKFNEFIKQQPETLTFNE